MALFIIADDSHRVNRMKGRGGYTDDVIPPRRKPVKIEDVDNMYLGSRKAARISDYAMDDGEDLSRRSQKKDRALLDDITTKLNKLEFENIKPEREVAMKTGFRRHIYGRARVPIEKETREQRRQAELRYPWDYTTDNMFRPRKKKPKNAAERAEERKRNEKLPMWLKSERVAPAPPKDPYPEHDPYALYRPREKREKKDYSGCLAAKKYEDMGVREMLANMKAKAASLPIKRDMARDVDTLMMDMCKPIQRSQPVEYKSLDDEFDPDWEYTKEPGLDDRTKSKIRDSRGDLAQFEQMLEAKFGRGKGKGASSSSYRPSSPPPLKAPSSRIPPPVDLAASMRQMERELGVDDEAYGEDIYYAPLPPTGSAGPAREVRARTASRGAAAAGAGGGGGGGRAAVRRRPGSLPPSAGRNRINQAEIEVDFDDIDEYDDDEYYYE